MTFDIIPAHDLPLAAQAAIFTEAFRGYVGGSFALDAAALGRFICAQGADLCYSRFARNSARLCGFGYITRTGDTARLAGMGVIAAARREGVARALLLHLNEEARARGDQAMLLEVIEQNPPACALYRREGFHELTRLCGWRRADQSEKSATTKTPVALEEISLTAACQLSSANEFPELPWPISRHAIARMAAGRAYLSRRALVVIGNPQAPGPVRIHALSTVPPGSPDWTDWAAIHQACSAVLALHRGREFFAPPVFPEEFSEKIFLPLGFEKESLSQLLMRYEL